MGSLSPSSYMFAIRIRVPGYILQILAKPFDFGLHNDAPMQYANTKPQQNLLMAFEMLSHCEFMVEDI